jgi:glycosyltransferase involved in cell wall biosynthesis
MLAIDSTGTSNTRANTGIQRVTRSLVKGLTNLTMAQPVCFEKIYNCWGLPDKQAKKRIYHQEDLRPGNRRGVRWSPWKYMLKALGSKDTRPADSFHFDGFIEPEIFSNRISLKLDNFLKLVSGPSIALYYDSTCLKLPEISPKNNTERFPAYLQQLLKFDGLAAISETSNEEIIDYWKWLGFKNTPIVKTIPLAVDMSHHLRTSSVEPKRQKMPTVLCVGSIEGRKNQVSLLSAAEKLWSAGMEFNVKLVGLESPETSGPALDLLNQCKIKGRPVDWLGPQSENDLRTHYENCSFTVYPSIAEGFGLPVLESLKHGKPCICSSQGAIGEISNGGGCLTVEKPTPEALAQAMKTLLTDSEQHSTLCNEARSRTFRTWSDYANDILEFHKNLNKSHNKA